MNEKNDSRNFSPIELTLLSNNHSDGKNVTALHTQTHTHQQIYSWCLLGKTVTVAIIFLPIQKLCALIEITAAVGWLVGWCACLPYGCMILVDIALKINKPHDIEIELKCSHFFSTLHVLCSLIIYL